jgi:hypothetical protein
MIRQRPDLIVPIRDRRRRKRYLTKRNFVIVVAVALAVFVVISTRSELRGTRPGEFGRIVKREIPPVEEKPMEVVNEAPPVVEQATTPAEPMWLEEESTTAAVVPMTTASVTRGDADLTIVGGPGGVTITQRERRRPVLSGGFGRD